MDTRLLKDMTTLVNKSSEIIWKMVIRQRCYHVFLTFHIHVLLMWWTMIHCCYIILILKTICVDIKWTNRLEIDSSFSWLYRDLSWFYINIDMSNENRQEILCKPGTTLKPEKSRVYDFYEENPKYTHFSLQVDELTTYRWQCLVWEFSVKVKNSLCNESFHVSFCNCFYQKMKFLFQRASLELPSRYFSQSLRKRPRLVSSFIKFYWLPTARKLNSRKLVNLT